MSGTPGSLLAVVLAEDETHLNLLPHLRASWTLRGMRPGILTPGTNRKITVLGAIEVTTGRWVYRLGRRCTADFIALLDQVLRAFPQAPVIAVICDNDSIHHARKVSRCHPPGGSQCGTGRPPSRRSHPELRVEGRSTRRLHHHR